MSVIRSALLSALIVSGISAPLWAQERPYFVTYDHYLEEPGNLELAVASTSGFPPEGRGYTAPWLEVEYGLKGWWTTEVYLEGVATSHDGSAFTGFRWENRFRPFKGEHRINPVFYAEYERVTEASRITKEVVGAGSKAITDFDELREEHVHELEGKLILSSAVRNWHIAENLTVEKNLSEDEGLEFGYSVGISRPLGTLASESRCVFCKENFVLGAEAYGGLGTTEGEFSESRHFIAPVLAWQFGPRSALKASLGFGLTNTSENYLLRFGWVYEFPAWWSR